MGAFDWKTDPALNGTVDPGLPVQDGASSRAYPAAIRELMAGVRGLSDDIGGAITTSGTLNGYTAATASGVTQLRAGVSILLKVDRDNTGAAFLNVDGTGPKPWGDADGGVFDAGRLKRNRMVRVTYNAVADAWNSDILAALDNTSDLQKSKLGNPIGDTIALTVSIARADITARTIPFNSFILSGFNAVGDTGAGARYVRGTGADFLAVQDAAGTWFKIDLSGGFVTLGQIGAEPNDASASASNTTAINGAIKALDAFNGGIIRGAGGFYVAGIDNRYSRVFVEGPARDSGHDAGAPVYGLTFVAPPGFAGDLLRHRTPTAAERGVAPSQNFRTAGGGFRYLNAIGGGQCLRVTSTNCGEYIVRTLNATGVGGTVFDCLSDYRNGLTYEMGEASDVQAALIDIDAQQDAGASTGAVDCVVFNGVDGDLAGGNPSYNFGIRIKARHANGLGMRIRNGDNLVFQSFRTSQVGGTGKSFLIQASVLGRVTDGIEFQHYGATGTNHAGYVEGTADRAGAVTPGQLTIWKIDASNGTPAPTAGADALLAIHDLLGIQSGLSTIGAAFGENAYGVGQAKAMLTATTPVAIYGGSAVLAALGGGATRYNVEMNGGNLRLRRIDGGTGTLECPAVTSGGDVTANGRFLPFVDNNYSLGTASLRYTTGYFASNIIVGSDAKLKTAPQPLPSELLAALREVSIVWFKYLSAIATKGETRARKHVGVIAQDVVAACQRHGIDAFEWGFVGRDQDQVSVTKTRTVQRPIYDTATEATVDENEENDIIVLQPGTREVKTARMVEVSVVDAGGKPVLIERNGETVQATRQRPAMEAVEETYADVEMADSYTLSVRYEQLALAMVAALRP